MGRKLRVVKVPELQCRTCKYKWFPRIQRSTGKPIAPKNCPEPGCKSPYWYVPFGEKWTAKEKKSYLIQLVAV